MADSEHRDQWVSAEYFQSSSHGDGRTPADKTLEVMEPVAGLKTSLAKCNAAVALH